MNGVAISLSLCASVFQFNGYITYQRIDKRQHWEDDDEQLLDNNQRGDYCNTTLKVTRGDVSQQDNSTIN